VPALSQEQNAELLVNGGEVEGLGVDLLPGRQGPLQKPFGFRGPPLELLHLRQADQAPDRLLPLRVEALVERKGVLPRLFRLRKLVTPQRELAETHETLPHEAPTGIELLQDGDLPLEKVFSGVVIAAAIRD